MHPHDHRHRDRFKTGINSGFPHLNQLTVDLVGAGGRITFLLEEGSNMVRDRHHVEAEWCLAIPQHKLLVDLLLPPTIIFTTSKEIIALLIHLFGDTGHNFLNSIVVLPSADANSPV